MSHRPFATCSVAAVTLLLLVPLAVGPTGADPILNDAIAPTAFSYLPLFAGYQPTATPVPGRPVRGYCSGQNNAFTVSSGGGEVCGFRMYWSDSSACGLSSSYSTPCYPIDADGHFTYDASFGSDVTRYEGRFTSSAAVDGVWTVQRGTCLARDAWSAAATAGGPFNCNRVGSVEICAWVDDPTPWQSQGATVYGQLLDAGQGQDGLPMHVEWHFHSGAEICDRQTGSDGPGLARCHHSTYQAAVGYTVIVDITTTYGAETYAASTRFTPR